MPKIALITDSSCDLSREKIKEHNIEVLPLRVIYQNSEYRDGVDISTAEICSRFDEEIPTTSMPAPSDFLERFQKLKENGYTHCIVITMSSGLSGTYAMVKQMSKEISEMVIDIIDSKCLSLPLGFLVLEAARLIESKSDSYQEILSSLNSFQEKVKGFFIVDSLEYLKKGGRIGSVAAKIGSILNIKPIISIDREGKYYPYAIARGSKQSVEKLLEPLLKQIEQTKVKVGVLHGMAIDRANALAERIKSIEKIGEVQISEVSPALLVHTGPGLLGLSFYPIDEGTYFK